MRFRTLSALGAAALALGVVATPGVSSAGPPHHVRAVRTEQHTRVTRVLVMLTYWKKHDSVTPKQAKHVVITAANAWYRRASYGRQGITGTATRWLHVPEPDGGCDSFDPTYLAAAKRAAASYHPSRYDRIVLYQPCRSEGGSDLGSGEIGGNLAILTKGGMDLPTAVHEQGHNYGLWHSNQLSCDRHGKPSTYRPGARCTENEYLDLSSAMSEQWSTKYAGDFTAPQKYKLGWLTGHLRTVRGSGTVRLAPYETKSGTKAIRVPGTKHRTYWIEYRTRRGNDAHLPAQYSGVLIHMSRPSRDLDDLDQSLQLDAIPPNADPSLFTQQSTPAYLPVGSSWTTPDGIRIALDSQSSGSAKVTITRHAKPHQPGPVHDIKATPLDKKATVAFRPPTADGGYPVTKYLVTVAPGGAHKTVHAVGAGTVHATFGRLHDGTTYRFTIRAENELGAGSARQSSHVTPKPLYPTPVIVSPKEGASVAGVVPISVKATPPPGSAIDDLELAVDDGGMIGTVDDRSHGVIRWDTSGETLGERTLTLTATDSQGRSKSTSVTVDLTQTTGPALTITGPTGSNLSGDQTISGTVAPNPTSGRKVTEVEVDVDGEYLDEVDDPGSSWQVDWDAGSFAAGKHVITAIASDTAGDSTMASTSVTVAVGVELTLTAPASGASVHGSVDFTGSVTNDSPRAGVVVDVSEIFPGGSSEDDGEQDLDTAAGHTDSFDVPVAADETPTGEHRFRVTATDADGQTVHTTLTLSVTDPKSTITLTAPSASVTTISGTVEFTATVQNNSSDPEPAVEADIDGVPYDSADGNAPPGGTGTYSIEIDTTELANGPHKFRLKLIWSEGTASASRTLTVAN